MRRLALIVILVVGVLGAIVVLRPARDNGAKHPTARIERATIERIVVASGTIEPEQLVDVRPRISGIVERFHVNAGDRVEAATIVAELERQALEAAVREADAVVHEARVARDQSEVDRQRQARLFEGGVGSAEALDHIRSATAGAIARLARASATLERLQLELGYATVTAPIAGIVLRRDLDPGAAVASVATVTGGTVLMTIADTSRMHLLGIVDENEIASVKVGMPARIRTETYPGRVFAGRVRKIASIGDRLNNVTSFKVEVDVLDGSDAMWVRMSADADIVAEVRSNAMVAPEAALLYEGDKVDVDVVSPESADGKARRSVTTGVTQGDRVEILEGLAEGDQVLLQ